MKLQSRLSAILAAAAILLSGCAKNSDLDALSKRVDSIEQKQAQDSESLISSIQASITSLQNTDTLLKDYISVLQSRVASLEQSDGDHQSEIDALKDAVKSLQEKDTDLQKKIDELKEYVDGLVSGTKDWADATFVTLEQYNATAEVIKGIHTQMDELSSKITATEETVAAHTALFESLNDTVSAMRLDISTIKTQLASLLSRIQQVSYVPRYEDGKVHLPYEVSGVETTALTPGTAELDFELRPSSAAKELETLWKADNSILSVKAAYAITKAAVETVDLAISSVSAEGTILNVVFNGAGIKDDFFNGECSANVRLGISDGNNDIISDYIPMVPEFDIPFTDDKFRDWCVENFDRDGNGVINLLEAQMVTRIECINAGITSLDGIEYFSRLKNLNVSDNSLTALDVSGNRSLVSLDVSNNTSLASLDVSKTVKLIVSTGLKSSIYQIGQHVSVDGVTGIVYKTDSPAIVSTDETSCYWLDGKTWCTNKGSAWSMPSLDELKLIYNNKATLNSTLSSIGATQFSSNYYWSSPEYDSYNAYSLNFSSGRSDWYGKYLSYRVRAVRTL